MSGLCKCGEGLGNTGTPSGCVTVRSVFKGIFMMQTFASDGTENLIDASDDIDDAYILDKINEADVSKRWFPLQGIESLSSERGDPVYETFSSGRRGFVKQGERPVTFDVIGMSPVLAGNIERGRCKKVSFFFLESGKIYGMDRTGLGLFLHPIRISENSLSVKDVYATDTTAQKGTITFDFDTREMDSNLAYIETEDDADVTGYTGLIDINAEYSNITTTGFKVKLYHGFSAINNKGLLTGLELADFALYNVTDSAAITPTSVTEAEDGYTFAFVAQTSAEVLRLTPTKNSYDFAKVVAKTVTIP